MEPLISVVVPVYNIEQYLKECIESIRNQTYKNLEIILVDDGSPDNCPKMCDKFAEKDSRIWVIHKKNSGAADARNLGIEHAKGEYVIFVDGDDWIHKDLVSIFFKVLKQSGTMAVSCEYKTTNKRYKEIKVKNISYNVLTGWEATKLCLYQKIKNGPCAILLPLEICKKNPFPSGRYYEDLFTTHKFFWNCTNIAFISSRLYYYRDNPDSAMHRKFTAKMFDEIDATEEIMEFIKSVEPRLLPAANARKFSAYAQVLRWIPQNTKDEFLISMQNKLWSFIRKYRWKMMFDFKARRRNRLGALCSLLGLKLFQRI